jgi:3-hydroxymyristoyl/3-hydroxydecanoyl-(acyl carrier protein) dehydratase
VFELLRSLAVDAAAGRARGEAFVPAGHPLFADHFPAHATLPGTLAVELAAQVAGPLAEEVAALQGDGGNARYAVLGMIRSAKFLQPVPLPARLDIEAEVRRCDPSQVTVVVTARAAETPVLRAELLLAMIEATPEWSAAVALRDVRVAGWKRAAEPALEEPR